MTPEEQKADAALAHEFVTSAIYPWFVKHLERQRDGLAMLAGNPALTDAQRAHTCGKLALVVELLREPQKLLRIAADTEKQLTIVPRRRAPVVTPSRL